MNQVSTKWELCLLPCAGCCLELQNVESSEAMIVASYSCWKPMFLVGRLIGVCSLSTSMRNLGLQPVLGIGPARRPGSPHPSEVAQGFGLIPVDSVGEVAGVGSEVASEEKIGGNGVEGTFNKDMTKDETIFERHAMNRSKTLSLEENV